LNNPVRYKPVAFRFVSLCFFAAVKTTKHVEVIMEQDAAGITAQQKRQQQQHR